ncbi:unnamed protein product [Pleuronectes platessa]|uniref:Ig-like domain-containing protein n=1 Tax=Pleuronectes platessa TaxID=8262 RepID=A0A9N7VM97_PLEPL|nr:unnamed protein product [Pleuronectes platessa]
MMLDHQLGKLFPQQHESRRCRVGSWVHYGLWTSKQMKRLEGETDVLARTLTWHVPTLIVAGRAKYESINSDQLLHRAYSEEPEPVFRAQGSIIEMGYCFGVDYIVVYRSGPGGDKLLGNSSDNSTPVTPPAELLDRVRLNHDNQLLGLQILNLTHMDSGIYRRECWQNQKLSSQLTQRLSVCDEEVESEEIIVKEGAAGFELLCNSTSAGLEGTSVHWYHETHPSFETTLFLDSGVSLEPVVEAMKGLVEVRDRGASLVIDKSLLKSSQHFHCLVIKGKKCLSFQDMSLQDHSDSMAIFVSLGDRVVLKCPSEGENQQWDTPLGKINSSSPGNKKPQEKKDFGGRNFTLECKVSHGDSLRVLWYRTETSGEYNLILDSDDKTAPSLEDLKGRMNDAGVYCCVVLKGPDFLDDDDDFTYDYDGDDPDDDDEYGEVHFWNRCILKQETILTLINPVTSNPKTRKLDANTPTDPPPASNVTAYAAGAGVAALLVVGAIAAAIGAVLGGISSSATCSLAAAGLSLPSPNLL